MIVWFKVRPVPSTGEYGVRWLAMGEKEGEIVLERVFESRHDALVQCITWMVALRKDGTICEWDRD